MASRMRESVCSCELAADGALCEQSALEHMAGEGAMGCWVVVVVGVLRRERGGRAGGGGQYGGREQSGSRDTYEREIVGGDDGDGMGEWMAISFGRWAS